MDTNRGMPLNIETIKITDELLSFIAEIDEFKGAWRALGALAPERLSALQRVATIESIGSSIRIEGSQLSDAQIASLLSNVDVTSYGSRDGQEVAGCAQTMATVFEHAKAIDLTENHIKQLHLELLSHSKKDERHRGQYKTNPNNVGAFDLDGNQIGIVFETATPIATPSLMSELVEWTNSALSTKKTHPLLVIGVFTVTFLEIHPFQDGNGRLSRILTTLLLLRSGYSYVPYSSLESVIEHSKESYYQALQQTQKSIRSPAPDWQPWLTFFLRSLRKQKQHLETKIEREHLVLTRLPALSASIIEFASEHGRLSLSQIVELTGANRNTVKKHLQALVGNRQLAQHGRGKGTWYSPPNHSA